MIAFAVIVSTAALVLACTLAWLLLDLKSRVDSLNAKVGYIDSVAVRLARLERLETERSYGGTTGGGN